MYIIKGIEVFKVKEKVCSDYEKIGGTDNEVIVPAIELDQFLIHIKKSDAFKNFDFDKNSKLNKLFELFIMTDYVTVPKITVIPDEKSY